MLLHMSLLAQEVNFTPDFNAIPGAGPVQQLINGIGAFALLLSLVGIIIGEAMWGVGSLSSNYHTKGILQLADQIVVVMSPSLDSASATLDWLNENGHAELVRNATFPLVKGNVRRRHVGRRLAARSPSG
jgi:hypothetical protein